MSVKEKTVKELFAVSGNLCALCLSENNIPTLLVDKDGTLIAEIAHIRAQSKGGPRYDPNYKNVDELPNLMALCCNCHERIDKEEKVKYYTVKKLEEIKKNHEAKFTNAIRDLSTVFDVTKMNAPIYPKNLKKYIKGEDEQDLLLKDFQRFIDKLKMLTVDCRTFLKICLERSKISSYCNGCRVLAEDINMVLQSSYKLKKLYNVCNEHDFIYDETDIENKYYLCLYFKTETHIDIFEGLKNFSERYNISLDTFFDDLDFSSLDD